MASVHDHWKRGREGELYCQGLSRSLLARQEHEWQRLVHKTFFVSLVCDTSSARALREINVLHYLGFPVVAKQAISLAKREGLLNLDE